MFILGPKHSCAWCNHRFMDGHLVVQHLHFVTPQHFQPLIIIPSVCIDLQWITKHKIITISKSSYSQGHI
jgi:hypothetical protein